MTRLATGRGTPTTVAPHDGDSLVEARFDHSFGVDRTPAEVSSVVKRGGLR